MKLLCTLSLILIINCTRSANILGIIPTPSHSHQVAFWPLWKELSLRGHRVTVITTDPINNKELTNLTEINIHDLHGIWEINFLAMLEKPIWNFFHDYNNLLKKWSHKALSKFEVQRLITDKTVHFDLVMIEGFHTASHAFAFRFKCPLILLSSLDAGVFAYEEIRNPAHPVLHPDYMVPVNVKKSFFDRLRSVGHIVLTRLVQVYLYLPTQQLLVEKHFGEGYPLIQDLFKNYSVYFVNTNNLLQPIRPLLPNVIQIGGGTHLRKQNPLPGDLQSLLDNASNGFIYFSLGNNVKSKHLPNETRQEIVNTFKELPYTILWKFESNNIINIPPNVVISKWFPQQDIFRHPNLKLFITQGGLQSLEEAILDHVPLIGIPVLADQIGNIANVVSKGLGLSLHHKNITKETFKPMILEVINNHKYRNNVKDAAKFLQDQPATGLERAVWWTEYVLRHKGAPHLRNPGLDLPWYQDYLLDIFGFLFLVLVFLVCLFYAVCKVCIRISKFLKQNSKLKLA